MQVSRLEQAWRIWICPWVLLQAYVTVLVLFFVVLNPMIESQENAAYFLENMLIFAIGGSMLAVWYVMMNLYEKVKLVQVRRRTRGFFVFFASVYALYTVLTVYELVKEV